MMELDEKLVALWFLPMTEKSDWMAMLREIEPDAKYELVYRFRYYKDDKFFDSADKKNWYRGETTNTRAYCIASLRSVGESLLQQHVAIGPLTELVNDKGIDDFMRRFQDQPFVVVRMEGDVKDSGAA